MGTLREDYKDALFDGQRRYQITQNDDGTYTIIDATSYTQEGDRFGANDINDTNAEVNRVADEMGNKAAVGHTHTAAEVGAAASNHTHTAAEVGAAAASHNHSADNITSGTLPVTRGGTGVTANPSMLTNLGSTTAASVFAASPRPGVTGTLPVANGGTGATTAEKALQNIVGFKPVQQGGGTSQGTNKIYIGWSTSSDGIRCTVDSTDMGYMLTGPAMASGAVLIGNGGGKVTTRPITNNTGVANASGTNIPTCNTVNYHVREWLNRDTQVDAADTGYTAYRARGIALVTAVPSSITNGCAAFVYQ